MTTARSSNGRLKVINQPAIFGLGGAATAHPGSPIHARFLTKWSPEPGFKYDSSGAGPIRKGREDDWKRAAFFRVRHWDAAPYSHHDGGLEQGPIFAQFALQAMCFGGMCRMLRIISSLLFLDTESRRVRRLGTGVELSGGLAADLQLVTDVPNGEL
ncbi:hypothetical protein BS47DRAFT_1386882 [Hydnum rufescens UP504]|uniref:Uncharacterized protein n=1 Tax=Hydnum rufescens UP504 TaxID=1448309 RepID=A0A9P6E2T3_9AGAM|nr:hypothetical protein BS47DRAFT_1386882 [Hydnum rufescens UP504]